MSVEIIRRLFPPDKPRKYKADCKCLECGKWFVALYHEVKSGKIKSCGCLIVTRVNLAKANSRTRKTWDSMRNRCNNLNTKGYINYGARGISICKEWDDFHVFLQDMGERPVGTTLDRKDNDKGYCKDNCRWATPKEQACNRRSNTLYLYEGKMLPVSLISEQSGIPDHTLRKRLLVFGWTIEKATTEPVISSTVRKSRPIVVTNKLTGLVKEYASITEASKGINIDRRLIQKHLNRMPKNPTHDYSFHHKVVLGKNE